MRDSSASARMPIAMEPIKDPSLMWDPFTVHVGLI